MKPGTPINRPVWSINRLVFQKISGRFPGGLCQKLADFLSKIGKWNEKIGKWNEKTVKNNNMTSTKFAHANNP
jgi:hypothetical protein